VRHLTRLFVLPLLATLVGVTGAGIAPAGTVEDEWAFVRQINQVRAQAGRPPLGVYGPIRDIARNWAGTMASQNRLYHNPNLVAQVSAVAPDWREMGENIAYGDSVGAMHQAFMTSPPHKANILGDYNYVGVGVSYRNGTIWTSHVFLKASPGKPVLTEASSPIDQHYNALGGPSSFLGQPVTAETPTPDNSGRYRHYQGGSIYWSPATGAWEVHGAIRQEWSSLGWEQGFLRFPYTDETATPDGTGRYNHFQGGSIYWSLASGAHEVHGAIRDKWASLGWEQGFLRLPTSDELAVTGGRASYFQGGRVYWSVATGAREVHETILSRYLSAGGPNSALKLPTTDEYSVPGGRQSEFQGGSIYWNAATGATTLTLK
jgi:LGFP repeat/Cysteine-rich secretory protein family